eukprot:10334987-Karenia_brevis.AAC.1
MWVVLGGKLSHGHWSYSLVGYVAEYGSMDGRQTLPRAGLTAVLRALLAVDYFGKGVARVTVWSDSKIVVDGYKK